jgi:7tm Odorant receptor
MIKILFIFEEFSKLQMFWLNREKFNKFDVKIRKFHESAWNRKSSEIYEKYANYCFFVTKLMNFSYIGVGIITILNPIFVKLLTGKLVLPYGYKLPWFDEFSPIGYAINYCHHLLQAHFVVFGFLYTDGLYAIFIFHVYCVYDNLCLMLDELNEDLCDEVKRKSPDIRKKLVEIIKMHQELLRFASFKFFKAVFLNLCAAKFLRILQFAKDFEKLGENFKNFAYKVCREKIFYFLVCREPKKVEKHCFKGFYEAFAF